ncbi:MAG: hypothetical protein ACXWVS_11055 [Hyphomicrobium sp.]
MYMKIGNDFGDADLYFLKDILIMLDAKLLELDCKIQEARKNSIDPEGLGLFDKGEYIIGMGFAACQRYMTSTFGPMKVEKEDALKIGPNHENGESIATIINAAANYWKHCDEWRHVSFAREPESNMVVAILHDIDILTGHQKKTIKQIETVTPWADYTCSNLLASLIKTSELSELRLSLLVPFLEEWRNQLDKFISDHDKG